MLQLSTNDAVLHEAANLLQNPPDYEGFLAFLRARGFDKLDSIKGLMVKAGVSLADAKQIVHSSSTWQDRAKPDELFHASLAGTAEFVSRQRTGTEQ